MPKKFTNSIFIYFQSSESNNANARPGRQRKQKAQKNKPICSTKEGTGIAPFQPPTAKERLIIRNNHCFLIRNLEKIKTLKDRLTSVISTPIIQNGTGTATNMQQTLSAQISALRVPRNIKTRNLALVEHDPELEKTARTAGVLREICQELANYKDENNQITFAKLNIPSKKKYPKYYIQITNPIDLPQIEINVEKGVYKSPMLFEEAVIQMFDNAEKFFGKDSIEDIISNKLRSVYLEIKMKYVERLTTILGSTSDLLKNFIPSIKSDTNELICNSECVEDIIQCICGLYHDEGLMIQCSKCLVWQHTECTKADTTIDNYLCERCDRNRKVNYEIPLNEKTDKGYPYYLSLLRGDLQIRQSDTVYVLRDIPIETKNPKDKKDGIVKKHTYETIGDWNYTECDIFRVERLYIDNNGKRFIYGHHYLRPHETYHEPTRKFFPNEVLRVPLYEEVPIELVMAKCWVMDPITYCKGRPVDAIEEHIYICELHVDRSARMFRKIKKHQYSVCTKKYAFKMFENKIKISRTYAVRLYLLLNVPFNF